MNAGNPARPRDFIASLCVFQGTTLRALKSESYTGPVAAVAAARRLAKKERRTIYVAGLNRSGDAVIDGMAEFLAGDPDSDREDFREDRVRGRCFA